MNDAKSIVRPAAETFAVRPSERTLVGVGAFMDRPSAVRAQGRAVADGNNASGLQTVAAPVPASASRCAVRGEWRRA